MKPGDKIKTIKQVAKKLEELNDWAEIDLTLRTFGFATWDDVAYTGEDAMYRYCMDSLERGEDQKLIELREYTEVESGSQGTSEEINIREVLGPWQPQRFKLFISHITKDKVFVSKTKTALANYGIDGFVAHEDIKPTKAWMDEIVTALDTCDALSAFITPEYHSSLWTDQEVGYCIRRRVLIIPLGLGQTPYGFMGKFQGAQCKDKNPEEIAGIIYRVLLTSPLTKARMFESLVGSFEESPSFDDAAKRARLLRDDIDTWTPELLRRIQSAKENNMEISGSYVAAPIVNKILKDNTF